MALSQLLFIPSTVIPVAYYRPILLSFITTDNPLLSAVNAELSARIVDGIAELQSHNEGMGITVTGATGNDNDGAGVGAWLMIF